MVTHTRHLRSATRGFTIVELLIVVIIIAILASITVVAYGGVQARALNTRIITSVNSSLKLLTMYYNEHGTWPEEPAPGKQALEYCLGQNYPTAGASGTSTFDSSSIISPRQWCSTYDGSGRAESNWLKNAVASYGTLPQATALSMPMYAPIYGVSYPGFVLRWANNPSFTYPVVNGSTQNGSAHYVYYALTGSNITDCGNVSSAQYISTYMGKTGCLVMLEFIGV